jgi:hypothetical protein
MVGQQTRKVDGVAVVTGKLNVGTLVPQIVYCTVLCLRYWLITRRTVSPDVEGLEFTSLAVSPGIFLLSSLQALYLLSNPSGDVVWRHTPHITSIHSIQYSSELKTFATAAVGDRFIAVFSIDGSSVTSLGSLACTYDVRSFVIQNDTVLALTINGTLDIFHSFNTFDPNKKGGRTKAPSAEIHLKTSHSSKIEIQDAVPRGKQTMFSWIEGAKTGFELVDIHSMSGTIEITIETRREQPQQQVPHPCTESELIQVFETLR